LQGKGCRRQGKGCRLQVAGSLTRMHTCVQGGRVGDGSAGLKGRHVQTSTCRRARSLACKHAGMCRRARQLTCERACTCRQACPHACQYACMPARMHALCMHARTHACPYACMPVHMHARTHTCLYACMPTRMPIHMPVRVHAHAQARRHAQECRAGMHAHTSAASFASGSLASRSPMPPSPASRRRTISMTTCAAGHARWLRKWRTQCSHV